MNSYIPDFAIKVWSDTMLAILLYWLPLVVCTVGYLARTARNFIKDRALRETVGGGYYPTDTVGSLIGRAIVTLLPVANLWAAMFDLSPEIFSRCFKWLRMVFNQPLVPDSDAAKARRGKKP